MSLDIQALRDSFALVAEKETALAERFYTILFFRYPQAERLFGRNSRVKQAEMLTRALVSVIEHVDDAAWLSGTLGSLGARHVDYGVTAEMYDWVGECLIVALEQELGDEFTPRVRSAWIAAYGAIASLMQNGATTLRSPVATSHAP